MQMSAKRLVVLLWALSGMVGCGGAYDHDAAELQHGAITTGSWHTGTAMKAKRETFPSVVLSDGKVLVAGGYDGSTQSYLVSTELYDSAGNWTLAGNMAKPRANGKMVRLPSGKVLISGGTCGPVSLCGTIYDLYPNSAELFDPVFKTWSATGSMIERRWFHTMTLLATGKVLVVGGQRNSTPLSTAELYDPATGAWTATIGSMSTPRTGHSATLLSNGKVLVCGGYASGSTRLASCELYNPSTGKFDPTNPMRVGRTVHTATMLPTGKVMVAGGYNGTSALNSAELYNPSTGIWSDAASMPSAREYHIAELWNGKVILAGGDDHVQQAYLNTSALYDPTSNTWVNGGTMDSRRGYFSSAVLPSGRVLLMGGHTSIVSTSTTSSTELYY